VSFKVEFSEEALSQLRKLDNQSAGRILEKIGASAGDHLHFFERLAGREEYKLRVGDYRVIARILQKDKSIPIMSAGHRKNVYKDI
jgi:mRNA interferase RelE/StbE